MNTLLRKLPLPAKLVMLGLLPLVCMLFFAGQIHFEKTEKLNMIDSLQLELKRSMALTKLIDNVQLERRATLTWMLLNQGEAELALRRRETNAALNDLIKIEGSSFRNFKNYTLLDSLDRHRRVIDQKNIHPHQMTSRYTNLIFRLTTLANISVEGVPVLSPLNADMSSQRLLVQMATYLGILRGQVYYALFTKQEMSAQEIDQLKSLYTIYETYVTELKIKARNDIVVRYLQYRNTGQLERTMEFFVQMFRENSFDFSADAEAFRVTSAEAVDEIKALQAYVTGRLLEQMEIIHKQEKSNKDRNLLILALLIAFTLTIVLFTIQNINDSLNKLRTAAGKIALGETGIDLQLNSKDAIGNLAKSIKQIDVKNQELSSAAEEIGRGNFSVDLRPRSKDDLLTASVIKMRDDLRHYNEDNLATIWHQSGITAVSESVREEKDIKTLARDSLHAVANYLSADIGVFYSLENDQLHLLSSYAVSDPEKLPTLLNRGQTNIGEVAATSRIKHLKEVPADYFQIVSGTGHKSPGEIFIFPLVHNKTVEGVIEIGALDRFPPATARLISEIGADIAIALQAAKNRMRLQELLEETQSQSEELLSQHGELENLNAELETQTQKLQASEEELRVQQEELMQTNQELEERSRLLEEKNQLIVERNLEIQRKAEELAISTRYKSEFLANMSHELRTPLNSILLLSRLMAENNEKNLSVEQVEYARVIQSSGNGLLSLIDEILDLSKIEAGKMELDYSHVPVDEIASDLQDLFAPVARQKNVGLSINLDPALPHTIETDKGRVEQIIRNLLSNAFKFTSAGSVTLSFKLVSGQPSFIAISVLDTGIGIPKEKQQQVFEAFQQADGSTRRKYGGTGLGLSISRELAKLLGGEIKLTSEPDKGSEFTVLIPKKKIELHESETRRRLTAAAESASIQLEPVQPAQSIPAPVKKRFISPVIPESIPDDRNEISETDQVILIIEDDTSFAKVLLDYTRSMGYKGLVSVKGDEGIEMARHFRPMGILLDIQLPVKDGWEVMEELKADVQTRHIPVHIMSSFEVKKESLFKGAVDFINKPFAFDQMKEVFEKIEQVINRQHKKVLIVEENAKHAKALWYFLESANVNAEISGGVEKGVEALMKDNVDCVILDMGIPDQKAYETLESIKKKPGLETLPIIIFTGKSLSSVEEQKIRRYADSIVIKTAHSYQRILDEVSLFLHLVEQSKQEPTRSNGKRLGSLDEVLSGKTVLVADDDIRNIYSLTKALENHKMTVIAALDGKEALRMLGETPSIDIVLMDIMMPVLDGYEAITKIREDSKHKNLPIIAVTAKAMTGDREKCIQAGASDYISKPVDIDQLLSLLRVWLYDRSS